VKTDKREIYFDNAATSPVRQEVADRMSLFYSERYGNPSSLHQTGQRAKRALEDARDMVSGILGCKAGEIKFTSGGTESNNIALRGAALSNREKGRHIITSSIEHHAVLNVCHALKEEGFEVTYVPVTSSGIIDLDALCKSIRPDTILVSIMLVNNEIGTIQPVSQISELTRPKGILLHTDVCQAAGKMPVNVGDLGVDMLSLAAHKFYGPRGQGALYIRKGTKIKPLMFGGHQEGMLRPGTENLPGIAGLAEALRHAVEEMPSESKRLLGLRDRLEQGIKDRVSSVVFNGHRELRIPGISNMSFNGFDGETLLLALDTFGISISTGSACNAGSTEPSHVLMAMGFERRLAQGSLRFSLGRQNTGEEVDIVVNTLSQIVEQLRTV
jgi:cysteine desulfurase